MNEPRTTAQHIPFHRPTIGFEETEAVIRALRSGHLTGNGPITRRVEAQLQALLKIPHVLLTSSCTSALEMSLLVMGIGPGDEVILPSFTFVSCATAIVRCGATPVFVDIDPQTLMIDVAHTERVVTPRTRAILCVHYGGFPCEIDRLLAISARHGVAVIEDAAQALGSQLRGRLLGTWGTIGCFSFHGTKNVTCGEGGAFVTRDDSVAARARLIREKGTNREAFMQQDVDRYTWVETGGSFVLSDVLAALLEVQLGRLETVTRERQAIGRRYLEGLVPLAEAGRIQLPRVQEPAAVNWHTCYLLARSVTERDALLRHLREAGIEAAFHFLPLHSSPYAQAHYRTRPEDLPVSEDVARRLIRLPVYPGLTSDDQDAVLETVYSFFQGSGHD